ncbi:MAG TPA: hypothetical protein VNZ49_09355 [Bacteroidia bacterium]|jgi:hypothetical protein|nr:hypothetical protein [Bacteroidia bacterium]
MKKVILLVTFPLLFIDACSSFKLEKRNSETERSVTKQAKEFSGSEMKFIRIDAASIRKTLIVSDDNATEHNFMVKPLLLKSNQKQSFKKIKPSAKNMSRVKF